MLLVVFLLVNDDIPVHQEVVKQEELPGLRLLPARLREYTFAHQDSA
jgi:hypothetical protein